MAAKNFRSKPVVIQAVQWTGNNFAEVLSLDKSISGPYPWEPGKDCVAIMGISGNRPNVSPRDRQNVFPGEWIVKDSIGLFKCLDEVFREEYEPIPEDTSHTFEEDFAHFLSYSGLTREKPGHRDLMRRAFEAGRKPREITDGTI